ncbi:hypothetical protein T4D_10855 [Trichinella pseudospiralis]|uniref:Uncharacterized protein n=1 Tax=Trichinella pseudospiralis TaxID=6337 RepID=A0A0V1FHW6_TRIPS|nr:hypothetical protein T4D_10855 [Trichinella pseudospiralis]
MDTSIGEAAIGAVHAEGDGNLLKLYVMDRALAKQLLAPYMLNTLEEEGNIHYTAVAYRGVLLPHDTSSMENEHPRHGVHVAEATAFNHPSRFIEVMEVESNFRYIVVAYRGFLFPHCTSSSTDVVQSTCMLAVGWWTPRWFAHKWSAFILKKLLYADAHETNERKRLRIASGRMQETLVYNRNKNMDSLFCTITAVQLKDERRAI